MSLAEPMATASPQHLLVQCLLAASQQQQVLVTGARPMAAARLLVHQPPPPHPPPQLQPQPEPAQPELPMKLPRQHEKLLLPPLALPPPLSPLAALHLLLATQQPRQAMRPMVRQQPAPE